MVAVVVVVVVLLLLLLLFFFHFLLLLLQLCIISTLTVHHFFSVFLEVVMVADTPIRVDRTPPISGSVRDGSTATADSEYQHNISTLCVSWGGFSDPDTGISLYQWKIGTSPGENNTLPLRNLTAVEVSARTACAHGLILADSAIYYSTITAVNGAAKSQSVSVSSNGGTYYSTSSLQVDFEKGSSFK